MKIKVPFSKNGIEGVVEYDSALQSVVVTHPYQDVQEDIKKYLETEQVFRIPIGSDLDEDREDHAKPIENDTYFSLAMCTLFVNKGAWVFWEREEVEE